MRTFLFANLLLALTSCGASSSTSLKDDKDAKKAAKLNVGDPAPAMTVSKWLNGDPLPAFERGKVYIVEFWAVWCGPCIKVMPHLAELASEYKSDVVVVGVTTTDPRNTAPQVEEFVAKRGPKLGYRFALCTTEETDKAYMQAAERNGIPCSFVVDKQGKIAYIGHPMELDDVIPKVVAGTWNHAVDTPIIEKMRDQLGEILDLAEKQPVKALEGLAGFESKYPDKAKQAQYLASKVLLQVQAKKFHEAKALTEQLMPSLIAKKSVDLLGNIRFAWADEQFNPEKKHVELGLKAADAVLEIEGNASAAPFFYAAEAYFFAGNAAKALKLIDQAISIAEVEKEKEFLKEKRKRYESGKK